MLVLKEMDGVIYAADMDQAQSAQIPGNFRQVWTPIGPGDAPVVTWDIQGCFVTFNYLDHVYTRRLDTSNWPPQVIDPVTLGPTSIQEPHDAIGIQHQSLVMGVRVVDEYMPGVGRLKRTKGMYYDVLTDTYLTSLVRDDYMPPYPLPATRKKWRLYIRDLGATDWVLLQDWIPELPEVTLTRTGAMKLQLMCTYGHMWTMDGRNADPNLTGLYRESLPGVILTIDSDLEGRTYVSNPAEVIKNPGASGAAFAMDRLLFGGGQGADVLHFGYGLLVESWPYPYRSSPFLVQTTQDALPYQGGASGTALLYS